MLNIKCALCTALFVLLPVVMAGTDVAEIDYQGWKRSIEISNGHAKLVVVPAIGRIMHYGFIDGANILWSDPSLHGQTLAGEPKRNKAGKYVWTNFGGDKVWPNEQSDFKRINGYSWPPDHWFDGGPHQIEMLGDGVIMTSAVSNYNGARSIRTIQLAPTGSRVNIGQQIEKLQTARAEPLRYTIWSVTQLIPPREVLFNLNPLSKFSLGYYVFPSSRATALKNFKLEGRIGVFLPDPLKCQKTGADSNHWLAAIVDNTVIAQFFRRVPAQSYPDGGLSAEVFTCPNYTELEVLSPLMTLQVGQRMQFSISWELHRLEDGFGTAEQRRAAALDWLSNRP